MCVRGFVTTSFVLLAKLAFCFLTHIKKKKSLSGGFCLINKEAAFIQKCRPGSSEVRGFAALTEMDRC